MAIRKTVGTALVEEINIFDQETEKWYHNLQRKRFRVASVNKAFNLLLQTEAIKEQCGFGLRGRPQ